MRALACLLIACITGCANPVALRKSDLDRPKELLGRSVLAVTNMTKTDDSITMGHGTAFAVIYNKSEGLMTAWHVAESGDHSLYITGNGVSTYCGPFTRIGNTDIAWFPMSLPEEWTALKIAVDRDNYGKVAAWGYPYTEDKLSVKYGEDKGVALFSSNEVRFQNLRLIIGVAIPGMSGGPVLDENGDVFAVISYTGWPTMNEHYPVKIPVP